MSRPNVIVIVADDLGYSDLSPYGSEIHTPNVEELVRDGGTLFTDFHTASACSPSRAMLLSGTDHHLVGFGQMAEVMMFHRDIWNDQPGYEGYLNDRVATLPELLRDLGGYRTMISGKWHLGSTPDRFPSKRGFQKSFTLLPGGGNHFNYESGTEDQPTLPFMPLLYARDQQFVSYQSLPKDFYSSDYFTSELIRFIDEKTDDDKDRPFFACLTFTAPHWPLQAHQHLIDKYQGVYDDGPGQLRQRRLDNQRRLGLLDPTVIPAPVSTNEKPWHSLTQQQKQFSSKTMQVYAAMVEQLDANIGRIIDYLKKINQYDNTLILVLSDNGAEGAILEAIPILSVDNQLFNNSYENLGAKDSFIWYGPRWAQAATAPSRLTKGYITEGGIRCPAILRYPPLTRHNQRITNEFCTIMDILPTLLQLVHVQHPGTFFNGRQILLPRGKSWISHFQSNQSIPIHDQQQDFTGWELFGQRAIRKGSYKAIYMSQLPLPNQPKWQLFDLSKDKGELNDLADEKPEILKELIELWLKYEYEMGVIVAPDPYQVEYTRFFLSKL